MKLKKYKMLLIGIASMLLVSNVSYAREEKSEFETLIEKVLKGEYNTLKEEEKKKITSILKLFENSFKDSEKSSIVIGKDSTSEAVNSVVIGNGITHKGNKRGENNSDENNSVVIGYKLDVDGVHNIVVATDYKNGDNLETKVLGEHNTVIGSGNLVGYTKENIEKRPNQMAKWKISKIGDKGSDQNVVVGMHNVTNGGSVVFGKSSEVEELGISFGYGNVVIGSDNQGGQHGLALGSSLKVKGEDAIAIGRESEAIGDWTIALGHGAKTKSFHSIAMGNKSEANGQYSVSIGASSESGYAATAIGGYGAKATANSSIALGSFSESNRKNGKVGYNSLGLSKAREILGKSDKSKEYNLKYDNWVKAWHELQKDKNNEELKKKNTDAYNEVSKYESIWESKLGALSIGKEGLTRQIINLAAGTEDTDAVNVAQLKELKNYVDHYSNPFEYYSKEKKQKVYKDANGYYTLKDGKREAITDTKDVIIKAVDMLQVGNVESAINDTSKTPSPTPDAGDKPNIKPDDSKDNYLVVVKDLKTLEGKVDKNKNEFNTFKTEVNNNMTKITKDIKKIDEKSSLALSGVSNAIAMANLPQVMGDNKFNLSAAYGYYGGSHALAVGFSGTNEKQNFVYKLSGSVNNSGNLALGAGFGIMLGKISYTNKLEETVKKQNAEIQNLKELVNKLMNK